MIKKKKKGIFRLKKKGEKGFIEGWYVLNLYLSISSSVPFNSLFLF